MCIGRHVRGARLSTPVGSDVTFVEAVIRDLRGARLITVPREKFCDLLDIVVPQIDTQNLAGVGPHPENAVHHIDPIDHEEGTIVPTNYEPR
jgi:hypothetical protein